jgi:endogenous inhibitor of DNA gyrase (YacG/DUF329 family)
MEEKMNTETVEVPCAICGSPIEIDPEQLKIKGATFVCSQQCVDEECEFQHMDKYK